MGERLPKISCRRWAERAARLRIFPEKPYPFHCGRSGGRRRPGPSGRSAPNMRACQGDRGPTKRARHKRQYCPQFWDGCSRRLPQSPAVDV